MKRFGINRAIPMDKRAAARVRLTRERLVSLCVKRDDLTDMSTSNSAKSRSAP